MRAPDTLVDFHTGTDTKPRRVASVTWAALFAAAACATSNAVSPQPTTTTRFPSKIDGSL
jgi:hypothetical protein